MAQKTLRCIGGSHHGDVLQVASGLNTVRLHAMEPHRFIEAVLTAPLACNPNIETYEVRRIFVGDCSMEVLVLDRLSEAAASRALADVIEGVER